MRHRTFLTVAALVVGFAVALVAAQDKGKTLTAIGSVAKVGGESLSVDTGKKTVEFTTTSATKVMVTGGSSKARAAKEVGEKGVKITDAVHVGDQVSVKYTDVGGKMVASEVDVKQRRPQSAQPVK